MTLSNTSQIVRQLDILRELVARRFGLTVKELSELYGVSPRTIERDIDDLCEAGFPLYSEKQDRENLWKILPNRSIPPINFPFQEIMALLFIQGLVAPFSETPFGIHFQASLNRIRTSLPDKMRFFLEKASGAYVPYLRGYKQPIPPEHFETINTAIAENRICQITYTAFSTNQTKSYSVEPLRLFHHHGGLYLLCRVSHYENIITLATERIQNLILTEETFTPPSDLHLETHIQNAFGVIQEEPQNVKVRFSPDQARYVTERIWHPTQEIETCEDGSILLSFQAGGLFEIKAWILSYGTSAEVLEPAQLREDIREELEASLKMYSK